MGLVGWFGVKHKADVPIPVLFVSVALVANDLTRFLAVGGRDDNTRTPWCITAIIIKVGVASDNKFHSFYSPLLVVG